MAVSSVVTPHVERYEDENPFQTDLVSNALDRKVIIRSTSMVEDDIEVLKSDVNLSSTDDLEPPFESEIETEMETDTGSISTIDLQKEETRKYGRWRRIFQVFKKQKESSDVQQGEIRVESGNERQEGGSRQGPLKEVFIPPNLPIEEIAKEVARVREEAIQSEKVKAESFWARAIEQADRPWIILLVSLTSGALILLMVVFYRLDMLSNIAGMQ
eukprot:TRINITY_DN38187_c0_g2_i4.p2 TRINITY_DN38187_c0_g2~~TRINITY_DN38187_c0_g2_i4.p2  ORF type:complete len:215 (-),score=32.85 TRINITY_DN38187_c0_g2_i4:217-861(-)